jgi:hypothetical protein
VTTETTMNNELYYEEGIGSRDRRSWLLFVLDGKVVLFEGATVPGVAAVVGTGFRKSGKWSTTTYRLALCPGVTALLGRMGWETGTFREGLGALAKAPTDTWPELAAGLGVGVPEAQAFLRAFRPTEAAYLDEVDAVLDAVDAAGDGASTIKVSFGGPTKRQAAEGFWARQAVPGGGELVLAEGAPLTGSSWIVPGAVRLEGRAGRILDIVHGRGHGGGYVTVTLALA